MKKALTITAIIILVVFIVYVNVRIYQNYMLNTQPTKLEDALIAIKNPSFTIDVLPDKEPLLNIQTSVETDLQNLTPSQIESIVTGYLESSYDSFKDYWEGN